MIYLDHNATTPLHPKVLDAMLPYLTGRFGNASSPYRAGRLARAALEDSRRCVAAQIGAVPEEIIFTGSGTESDNLALKGAAAAMKSRGDHIIISQIEHHAVLNTALALEKQGFRISLVPVDSNGTIDPGDVKKLITSKTILISIMLVNNETGVVQPVREIGEIARSNGILFHSDAVQAAGKIPIDVNHLNADLISLSAHKVYGPKGVGALYVRKDTPVIPLINGGRHEWGMRAGTENIAGIVGFSEALSLIFSSMEKDLPYVSSLRDLLEEKIKKQIKSVRVNAQKADRVCNTSSISFLSIEAESILLHLDINGICVSSGSACTTGSTGPSHVLLAMGINRRDAQSTLRFSLGPDNRKEEIEDTVEQLVGITGRLRKISSIETAGLLI